MSMSGKSVVWTKGCKFRRILASAAEAPLTNDQGSQLIQGSASLFHQFKFVLSSSQFSAQYK